MTNTKPEFIPTIDGANAEIARLHARIEAATSKTVGADGRCPTCGRSAQPLPTQQATTATQPAVRDPNPFKGMTGVARAVAANQRLQRKGK